MAPHRGTRDVAGAIRAKPLQAAKFVGILLALLLGIGGFFRVVDATAIVGHPLLGDGQFLALVFLPLLGLGLVLLVFLETLVTGYRALRSEKSVGELVAGRYGYVLLRGAEAAAAVAGVAIMSAALPPLFAESTPAPAGVGIMLLLAAVGVGILLASLLRSGSELLVYRGDA